MPPDEQRWRQGANWTRARSTTGGRAIINAKTVAESHEAAAILAGAAPIASDPRVRRKSEHKVALQIVCAATRHAACAAPQLVTPLSCVAGAVGGGMQLCARWPMRAKRCKKTI